MPASLLIACCLTLHGTPQQTAVGAPAPAQVMEERPAAQRLDAAAFFERLVARYRDLVSYRDLTSVVRIMREYPGSQAETQRTETQMICDILDGELRIITPGSQLRDSLRDSLGLSVRVREVRDAADTRGIERSTERDEAEETTTDGESSVDPATPRSLDCPALADRYRQWLAPHLTLKFADDPLSQMRPAAHEPFTATDASPVILEDRVMVHVELKSGRASAGHDAPDDFDAKFDLYINPESMLIERIEGRERLPDGGSVETTYTIQPMVATAAEPAIAAEEPQAFSGDGDADCADDSVPQSAPASTNGIENGPLTPAVAPHVDEPAHEAPNLPAALCPVTSA